MTALRRILILGGARSGKSAYGESLMPARGPKVYVATGEPGDEEMAARIAAHRARRGHGWTTVEAPLDLAAAIRAHCAADAHVMVDCVTLWLSNVLLAERDVAACVDELIDAVSGAAGTLILVSNEVGSGIVPDNPLARRFRDAAGWANQRLAAVADEVVFMAAGLPLVLKQPR
ncbi:MAG: bifunctional adenosylcobinamide kinase/adenosylcobinamide-phosphate guanylyltransferase [Hyphomicrobiales bacterium]|nr:bifunctional adenosylcobinamide kinase/adenosylcobinamide-phosphate guanylyltransferase [Hyphomicrobiales bacterium]